jgi:hypothetical protein
MSRKGRARGARTGRLLRAIVGRTAAGRRSFPPLTNKVHARESGTGRVPLSAGRRGTTPPGAPGGVVNCGAPATPPSAGVRVQAVSGLSPPRVAVMVIVAVLACLRSERVREHELRDLSSQRLTGVFVIAEMLSRVNAAYRGLGGRLRETLKAPRDPQTQQPPRARSSRAAVASTGCTPLLGRHNPHRIAKSTVPSRSATSSTCGDNASRWVAWGRSAGSRRHRMARQATHLR